MAQEQSEYRPIRSQPSWASSNENGEHLSYPSHVQTSQDTMPIIQDPVTGESKQVMKTPYKKAHRIGGSLPVFAGQTDIYLYFSFFFLGFRTKVAILFRSKYLR